MYPFMYMYLLKYMYMNDIISIEVIIMKIMSQTKARKDFFKIAKEVNEDNIPVIATNKESMDDVVILGKADYDSLMETLHVYGVPGMA